MLSALIGVHWASTQSRHLGRRESLKCARHRNLCRKSTPQQGQTAVAMYAFTCERSPCFALLCEAKALALEKVEPQRAHRCSKAAEGPLAAGGLQADSTKRSLATNLDHEAASAINCIQAAASSDM